MKITRNIVDHRNKYAITIKLEAVELEAFWALCRQGAIDINAGFINPYSDDVEGRKLLKRDKLAIKLGKQIEENI